MKSYSTFQKATIFIVSNFADKEKSCFANRPT